MIRIDRPATAPAALAAGGDLVAGYIGEHDADPTLFATRKGRFAFERAVFGHQSVRDVLKTAQHRKCCFCESRIEQVGRGEIEHFRPKSEWRQTRASKLTRPGYYWLAYSWDNLLWSCAICNGSHKKNLFPLVDEAARDCPGRSIRAEAHVLVDPAACDPREHIRFKLDRAIALTERGQATIDIVGLNRQPLVESRMIVRERLMYAWELVRQAGPEDMSRETRARRRLLRRSVRPHSPYTSMAIDLLTSLDGLAAGV